MKIAFSPSTTRIRLNQISAGLRQHKPQILNECAEKVVGLAKIYFDNLSNGGASISGRRWKEMSPATLRKRESLARRGKLASTATMQGIQSGKLIASLRSTVSQQGLTVNYWSKSADRFNVNRRLLPTVLPTEWRKQLEIIINQNLSEIEKS